MNDRHPSGTVTPPAPAPDAAEAHHAPYGHQDAPYGDFTMYDGYPATGFQSGGGGYETASFATDPLFGDMPGSDPGAATGSYDATQWSANGDSSPLAGAHQATPGFDPYAAQHQAAYDTGGYDTTDWAGGHQQLGGIPAQSQGQDSSGQWDATAWNQAAPANPLDDQGDHTQQWGTQPLDTGAYDATQWNGDGGQDAYETYDRAASSSETYDQPQAVPFDQQATATFEQVQYDQAGRPADEFDAGDGEDDQESQSLLLDGVEETAPEAAGPVPGSRSASRSGSRSRRRAPARRSALLTVAVPSACVMGVAGIAAASVVSVSADDNTETTAAAPETTSVKPSAANNQLDTQLANLSADADDFADRASRTQERIDLKAEQEAKRKQAAEDAARKERLRPKFSLPVAQKGLSAYYGQSGINWMSVHTGIDFPVSYGTTVMAATDGTVRTQWNSAYGNMAIVTAKDGTETWYCHLSTYKVPSGTVVKAGDPIAFSGNSGNSTGPHLHFEVRPAGGSAIDPLWGGGGRGRGAAGGPPRAAAPPPGR
ncbi:peptidoglycan DD-metalloendopeptidase family protein, partial [Streptomyces sp. NPDC005907]|uniref:peptidoglycan DD-metalloendopeptidase family protein n=1 Tax=Streptomyces sp. NPDC005907 TaxID=3154571 RepID=UPI0033EFC481